MDLSLSVRYRSRVDAWLALVLALSILASAAAAVVLWATGGWVWRLQTVVVLALGAGLPLWVWLGTHYTLAPGWLSVRSGPFGWRIAITDIERVVPTRSPLSSPALSLQRLRIEYAGRRAVMVSPREQAAFLQHLEGLRGVMKVS